MLGIFHTIEVNLKYIPANPNDAYEDFDSDGLTNLQEYQRDPGGDCDGDGIPDIYDTDDDHGGIDDGDELNYWNITRGLNMDTSVEYCKNPDVDGDNIPDGKELNGYSVKIITGWKLDGTPISRMRYISSNELDPLIPYGYNSSGVVMWTDSDWDNIPDVVESDRLSLAASLL